jgi:hypothetical protein
MDERVRELKRNGKPIDCTEEEWPKLRKQVQKLELRAQSELYKQMYAHEVARLDLKHGRVELAARPDLILE